MAKVTWKGWREEPQEDCKVAYEFLTGQRTKPLIVVFGRPETLKNKFEKDLENQNENLENELER